MYDLNAVFSFLIALMNIIIHECLSEYNIFKFEELKGSKIIIMS